MKNSKERSRFIVTCLSPAIILVILFMIIPTINVFFMSLYSWGGLSGTKKYHGLTNFQKLLVDKKFLQAMQNTVLLIVIVTLVTLAFAIIFASILSREKIKGQNFFRVIFYIPNILSIVVIAAIFGAIYNPTTGLLNSFLSFLKLENLQRMWMGESSIAIYSLAGALIWQAIGYYMVMYMAAMSSIPESLYESASLEGAGKVKQFFSITLPLIWNNIRTTLTFFIISTINLSFLLVKSMTGGGPNGATEVFLSYMYGQAYTNSSYGYGMAIGVVIFIFSFTLAAILNKVTERDVIEM